MEAAVLNNLYACSTVVIARHGMDYEQEGQCSVEWDEFEQRGSLEEFKTDLRDTIEGVLNNPNVGKYTTSWFMTSCADGQEQEKEWFEKLGFTFTPYATRLSIETDSGVSCIAHGFVPFTELIKTLELESYVNNNEPEREDEEDYEW